MLPQKELLNRLREKCLKDQCVVAAMLYGSFTTGEGDLFSDIEAAFFFEPKNLDLLDKRRWLAQIAPVLLFFHDYFGHDAVIFESLIRGEFHFKSAQDIGSIESWKGNVWFSSAEQAIIVDRTGELATSLQSLIGPPPAYDNPESAQGLAAGFYNFTLFGMNLLRRGELVRAFDMLNHVHRHLLWLARQVEGAYGHWPTPSRKFEEELSAQTCQRYHDCCTVALERQSLWEAFQVSWSWGRELTQILYGRYGLAEPRVLVERLDILAKGDPCTIST